MPRRVARDRTHPLRALGRGASSGWPSTSTRCRPTSTGSAPSSTTAASAWRRRRAGTTSCCIPLLDLTTTLDPYFSIAYRFGAIFLSEASPGGPGRPDQAVALLAEGRRRPTGEVAVPPRHRVRLLLALPRLRCRRDVVSARVRAARTRRTGSSRSRPRCWRGQRSRVRPIPVAADSPVRRRVAAAERRARAQRSSTPSTPSTSCRRSSTGSRRRPGGQYSWDALVRRRRPARHSRSIRPARRSSSIPPPAACRVSKQLEPFPLPEHLRTPPS